METIADKVEALRGTMQSDDPDAIQKSMDELSQAAHKLAELLYAQKTQGEPGGPQPGGPQPGGPQPGGPQPGARPGGPKGDDDVVDADYTEVK